MIRLFALIVELYSNPCTLVMLQVVVKSPSSQKGVIIGALFIVAVDMFKVSV